MTIYVGMDYIEYAANTMYGKNFCDLPESIRDEIEEYFDGLNLLKIQTLIPITCGLIALQKLTNVKLFG